LGFQIRYDIIKALIDKSTIVDLNYVLISLKKEDLSSILIASTSNIIFKVKENFYEKENNHKNINNYLINENEIDLI